MRKCLIIKIYGSVQTEPYKNFIQKNAANLNIEGTVQNETESEGLILYACGQSNNLDQFIDMLYKGIDKSKLKNIIAEPFVSEKDYRGVFRVIG